MYQISSIKSFGALPRMMLSTLTLAALAACIVTVPSRAAVTAVRDVLPADNPLTDGVNEGLPPNGNFADSSEPANAQTHWELPVSIIVGQSRDGRLDIDGNSQLRAEDLIIGDEGMLPNGQMRQGTGWVVVSGIDALYNNDPDILPPGLPSNFGSTAAFARPTDEGFDLYVGRAGFGTLDIRGGGTVEIQDVTIIADLPNSIGILRVDGFASFLGTGGFSQSGGPVDVIRQMLIGRQGEGTMRITNGGTVVAESFQQVTGITDTVGAVIGGEVFDNDQPETGGSGLVDVIGDDSRWIVGGSLQIGGFHDIPGLPAVTGPGATVQYDSTVGHGTLNVVDGALVSVRPPIDADELTDPLRLVIGRFGVLNLDDGYVSIGGAGQLGGAGEEEGRQDNIALINDGLISGDGRIDTGVFRNRYFGEISVDPGQTLVINATSEFQTPQDLTPMANWGLIKVTGTAESRSELEFERAPATTMDPIQPFFNLPLSPQPTTGARGVGQITAAHSTLRFRSGLSNAGKLVFTAGDNYVFGPVVNEAANVMDGLPAGEIGIAGNNTTVTFEDQFVNHGEFEMFSKSTLALFLNDFTQTGTGTLMLTLGGGPNGDTLSALSMLGDVSLAGGLSVNLAGNPFNPMPGDQYQILATGGLLSGIFTRQTFPTLGPGLGWFVDYNYPAGTVTLQVRDQMNDIMGADFNDDGVVNAADLAIWLMFNGLTSGASPAQGDADADGDVDGDDFFIWQRTIGPVPASGSGAGHNLAANVPEPSALMLLAWGGLVGIVWRRRR